MTARIEITSALGRKRLAVVRTSDVLIRVYDGEVVDLRYLDYNQAEIVGDPSESPRLRIKKAWGSGGIL